MTATTTPCSTAILAGKHTADLTLVASRFSQTLSQESFTIKLWLSFKVETWKFTKNKLLKLVGSIKAGFLFASLNLNRIIRKKKCQKKAYFMNDAFEASGIIHLDVETWLLFAPLSKFLDTRLDAVVTSSPSTPSSVVARSALCRTIPPKRFWPTFLVDEMLLRRAGLNEREAPGKVVTARPHNC